MTTHVHPVTSKSHAQLWAHARGWAIFTIAYNVTEGLASTIFGAGEESLSLFGFGVDSFIEMISGIGIWIMVNRIRRNGEGARSEGEKRALYITGFSFYMLATALTFGAILSFIFGHSPDSTVPGMVISAVSLLIMGYMVRSKEKIGTALNSPGIRADAMCARVCMYMSAILLASSGLYALTGFAWLDSLGAIGLAWFSIKEGRECFYNAKHDAVCTCSH